MKSLVLQKLVILLSLIILSNCKKTREEVIETVGKTITKETAKTAGELGSKAVIKSLTKKEIEYAIIENGLNKNVLKNVLEYLSNQEASLFINESRIFNSNIAKFNNNPDLVQAYKKLITSESHRNNISYLYQTENWIKKGSTKNLILEVPNNINKKLLGKNLNEVSFVNKTIHFQGLNLSVIVPDFSKYNIYRAPKLKTLFYNSQDKTQFAICRANLREDYLQNPNKIKKMLMIQNQRFAKNGGILSKGKFITDPHEMLEMQIKDIRQINSGNQQERIFGFVWHHNEEIGIIDLIAYDKHNSVKHIGGRNIWGGGSVARR